MEVVNKCFGSVVHHYEYEKKSNLVRAADLFLLFTVTFPLIGKTHTYNHRQRTFTEHRLALFEIRDPVTRALEVFLRIVSGALTVYLVATNLPFFLLLDVALITKFFSSENKRVHKLFLEGLHPAPAPQQEICSICREPFTENGELFNLECNHQYHKVCIDGWKNAGHDTCPLCRAPSQRLEGPRFSNREFLIDGNRVDSIPLYYASRLSQVQEFAARTEPVLSMDQDGPALRYFYGTGLFQVRHSENINHLLISERINGHLVEIRYTENRQQLINRIRRNAEGFQNIVHEVDGRRVNILPQAYRQRIIESARLYLIPNTLVFEQQMRERVPFIRGRWGTGFVQYIRNRNGYTHTFVENIDGHRIVIREQLTERMFNRLFV